MGYLTRKLLVKVLYVDLVKKKKKIKYPKILVILAPL